MVPGQQEPAAPEYKQYINLEPIGDANDKSGGVFLDKRRFLGPSPIIKGMVVNPCIYWDLLISIFWGFPVWNGCYGYPYSIIFLMKWGAKELLRVSQAYGSSNLKELSTSHGSFPLIDPLSLILTYRSLTSFAFNRLGCS